MIVYGSYLIVTATYVVFILIQWFSHPKILTTGLNKTEMSAYSVAAKTDGHQVDRHWEPQAS
jgi:hypothetical protein